MPRLIDVRARLIAADLPERDHFSARALGAVLDVSAETVHNAAYRKELPAPVRQSAYRLVWKRSTLVEWQRKLTGLS